jgi:3-deoxy-D-manno-octulosonic-acid transferase
MQMAPIDTPSAVQGFIGYWDPCAILLIESELWPNLIMHAAHQGVSEFLFPILFVLFIYFLIV